jgi:hypothetical protein
MNDDFVLIKEIVILDPPTYYSIKKVKKSKKAGEDVYDKHYLTGNLFYIQNVSYHVISKITHDVKLFLAEKIGFVPELEKMRLEIEYHRTTHIDLDNKIYFWKKLLLDILKSPTQRQLENVKKKRSEGKKVNDIISLNVIPDDSSKYFDYCTERFVVGEHKLVIRIFGRPKVQQEKLDLFFVND